VYKLLTLLLLALLVLLQVQLWAGDGGRAEVAELEQAVARQHKENRSLESRNEALEAEVVDLKEGQSAVEERARGELGMIYPGEVFYRVVEGNAVPAPQGEPAPASQTQTEPPQQ
jgi:cell division protein FtsB